VLASLWKVDDAATQLLMQRFYENVLGQYDDVRAGFSGGRCMPKDAALREAKIWLRNSAQTASPRFAARGGLASVPARHASPETATDYSDPYFWAAFVLVGAPE
jgi:CHAT domain-containing protein